MKGKKAPPGYFNVNTQALSKLMRRAPFPDRMAMEQRHRQLEQEYTAALALPHEAPELGAMLGIFELIDHSVKLSHEAKSARDIKCRRGCSACCYVHVTVTAPEATLAIMEAEDIGHEIDRERLRLQAEKRDDAEWHELPHELRRCVFLTDAGECAIYAYRPTACRRYFVVSDPADCDTLTKPGHEVQNFVSAGAEIAASAAMEVFESGTFAAMVLAKLKKESAQ